MTQSAAPREEAAELNCAGERLWGILARPPSGMVPKPVAVLIAVGGPQYRVGSHRQFVQLARALARHGYAVLRFDYRGMGDSEGDLRDFEHAEQDLRCGIDALARLQPQAQRIVVWGLCDAAAAALMFATTDSRVAGIVAANPWARSESSLGAARVKHYYLARLMQPEFWRKLAGGGFDWRGSLRSLTGNLKQARRHYTGAVDGGGNIGFQGRMAQGLAKFRGRLLLLVSGNDLTAMEFLQYAAASRDWNGLLSGPAVKRVDIAQADHTFSRRVWSEQVEFETIKWLQGLVDADSGDARPASSVPKIGKASIDE